VNRGILSLLCVFFAGPGKKDTQGIENDWQAKALVLLVCVMRMHRAGTPNPAKKYSRKGICVQL
jgi:hypothetical protein